MSTSTMAARLGAACGVAVAAGLIGLACAEDTPMASHASHDHEDPLLSAHAPPEVRKKIADLRRWSAPFHNLGKAAEAGYTINIGCIDETIVGVDPAVARGMGYHVTGPDFAPDGTVDIDAPEFLVYAPHVNDAELPKEERLGAARLVGFDYFVPGDLWTEPDPPEFFGEQFNWSEAFQGWMRHIYLWGHNPEGMFEDFNAHVRLCTDLLDP